MMQAEEQQHSPSGGGGVAGAGGGKLESLSRDDLLKLVKKYVALQKQLKTKNDELGAKLTQYEQQSTNESSAKVKKDW